MLRNVISSELHGRADKSVLYVAKSMRVSMRDEQRQLGHGSRARRVRPPMVPNWSFCDLVLLDARRVYAELLDATVCEGTAECPRPPTTSITPLPWLVAQVYFVSSGQQSSLVVQTAWGSFGMQVHFFLHFALHFFLAPLSFFSSQSFFFSHFFSQDLATASSAPAALFAMTSRIARFRPVQLPHVHVQI